VTGAGPTLTGTEATVGTITINDVDPLSPVLIVARANYTKDGTTTARVITTRLRRGSTNAGAQIGSDSVLQSQPLSNTPVGTAVIIGQDTAHGGGDLTYTLRALSAAGSPTTPAYEIEVVELKGVKGEKGDTGATGPQGPPGDAEGSGTLAGLTDVAIASPQLNDLLAFTGSSWANKQQENLTDGGNF
jgi:hypothetical protein